MPKIVIAVITKCVLYWLGLTELYQHYKQRKASILQAWQIDLYIQTAESNELGFPQGVRGGRQSPRWGEQSKIKGGEAFLARGRRVQG